MCVLRILFGILSLLNGLFYAPDFLTWFGSHGVISIQTAQLTGLKPSLLLYFNFSDPQIMALMWLFLIASLFVTIGLWTRWSIFLVWALCLTFHFRNPLLWHQVDSVLRVVGFCLLFSPAGAMYSIDDWLRRRRGAGSEPQLYSPWAQRLIQYQVACIYWKAFWGKAIGETWHQGTAVYYATHYTDNIRHQLPGFMDNMLFYKVASYYTLAIEFSMWSLVWIQPLTKWVLLGATLFHLGIDWCINLDLLEWGVMSTYVLFLKPAEVEHFMTVLGDFLLRRRKIATPS